MSSISPQGIETNIPEIAEQIFRGIPKPPFSIELGLETNANQSSLEKQTQCLFEVLANLMICGIHAKYGDGIDIRELTFNQIQQISDHFRSFGWDIVLETMEYNPDNGGLVLNARSEGDEETDSTKIAFYRLRFPDVKRKVFHEVRFQPYTATTATEKVPVKFNKVG